MPEGPSIIILKEAVQKFKGQKIIQAEGNAKLDIERMSGEKIIDIKTWGKHLLICFKGFTLRVHLMMFGSYRVNEERKAIPKLKLVFAKRYINFYACSLKYIEDDLDNIYDWSADVMNENFDSKAARGKIKRLPDELICDVLLNQEILAGVVSRSAKCHCGSRPHVRLDDSSPAMLKDPQCLAMKPQWTPATGGHAQVGADRARGSFP